MFKTFERSDYGGSSDGAVWVTRVFDPIPNTNPPTASTIKLPFVIPAYRRSYEKVRKWSTAYDRLIAGNVAHENYRKMWKPFQHYKCYLADTTNDILTGNTRYFPWSCVDTGLSKLYSSTTGIQYKGPGLRVNADPILFTDTSAFRSAFGKFGEHIAGLPSLTQVDVGDGFVPKPSGLNTLTALALKSMLPNIKSDMSLLNSIYELKDFKSLPATCSRLLDIADRFKGYGVFLKRNRSYLRRLPSKLRELYTTFRMQTPTLRELRHGTADNYLQQQFNVQPLLQDIASLSNALFELDKSFRSSLAHAGQRQHRHFNYAWQEYESPILYVKTLTGQVLNLGQFAGTTNPNGQLGCYNAHGQVFSVQRRTTHYQPTQFHAEIDYNYYYSNYQTEHAQLLTLLDRVGVNLDPSIIWNAIPWSFVVDWVISVQRWLKDRKTINMKPQVNVHRYLWSWTRHQRTAVYFWSTAAQGSGATYNPSIPDTYLPTLYESTYRRDVELPASNTSLFGSGLSAVELSLGVALANTPARHPHTRMR